MEKVIYYLLMVFCFINLNSCFSDKGENITKKKGKQIFYKKSQRKEYSYLEEIFNKKNNVQIFYINPNKLNEIKGREGTIITFPKDCLIGIKGTMKIELIECFSFKDIIFNGLTTQTLDDNILLTSGMIFINVFTEKDEIFNDFRKKINISIPSKGFKKDEKIFFSEDSKKIKKWEESKVKLFKKNEETEKKIQIVDDFYFDSLYGPDWREVLKIKEEKTKVNNFVVNKKQKVNTNLIYYSFSTTKIGWINIDSYLNEETQNVTVKVDKSDSKANFFILLKDRNSIFECRNLKNGNLNFIIPKNCSFSIMAFDIRNENIYFSLQEFSNVNKIQVLNELKESSKDNVTKEIEYKFGSRSVL